MTVDASRPTAGSPVVDVVFEERPVLLVLADGRALAAPLSWVAPAVIAMDDARRRGWVPTADGRGVNWPRAGQTSDAGALDAWTLEQDALFETALASLASADWDTTAVDDTTRGIVCLWRLVADGYNGGLLQFLGNWGIGEVELALALLSRIGAARTHDAVRAFWDLVGQIAGAEHINTMDDLHRSLAADHDGRADELDEAFWTAADELPVLIVTAYGPAPSAR